LNTDVAIKEAVLNKQFTYCSGYKEHANYILGR